MKITNQYAVKVFNTFGNSLNYPNIGVKSSSLFALNKTAMSEYWLSVCC
jgi:hypothetical protein